MRAQAGGSSSRATACRLAASDTPAPLSAVAFVCRSEPTQLAFNEQKTDDASVESVSVNLGEPFASIAPRTIAPRCTVPQHSAAPACVALLHLSPCDTAQLCLPLLACDHAAGGFLRPSSP
jgi:hypothetical protein